MDQKFSKYFRLEEFLTSSTARQRSIENLPSYQIVLNLKELASFLDRMREAWGSGIIVSSGFRNKALNAAVGGVSNSIHQTGFAVDLQPANGKFEAFKKFVVNWLKDKDFDECIIERSKKATWIHLQLFSNNGFQRRKIFNLNV